MKKEEQKIIKYHIEKDNEKYQMMMKILTLQAFIYKRKIMGLSLIV